ncbi:hypothetical protein [Geodermatophilus normandii]|uniref:Uncharacterized protein n=1 Tax=Geodermatophilus normandii TaxID=1137989 RepID=A0A6P0GFK9_9ACTN|nr:hypothetical protein [Geodermatophilus normandii]NEM06057.1 hypothetical protein [Geodermatophilus normandii]
MSVVPVPDGGAEWRARETVREVAAGPHLLLRLDVLGPTFPHRDVVPFVRLSDGRSSTAALMTEVSDDGTSLHAYFPTDVPLTGRIEFGYGSEVLGTLPIETGGEVERLEMARIDTPVHRVTTADPGAFAAQRR